jgi:G6PDH family F420-dependent oxidoreductase
MRMHPAIVAHAAATSSLMCGGRFELGVGSGENLNEHVLGNRWPITDERLDMLEEAVALMRMLWTGDEITHRGEHYVVENARIYSAPDAPVPVHVSGLGPKATDLAARIGDGYISTSPDKELLDRYRSNGGSGPASGSLRICWGPDEEECARTAHRLWRTSGLPGELSRELRTPTHFDQAATLVTVESVAESMPCGPDPQPIIEGVEEYARAGFDRVYISQVASNQEEFFRFYEKELAGALAGIGG